MSCIRHAVGLLFRPCGFGERQSFQKNRPHPPELAVGNNTSTKFPEPAHRKVCGFSVTPILPAVSMPASLIVARSRKDNPKMHPPECSCFLFGRACRCDTTDSLDRNGGPLRNIGLALIDIASGVTAHLRQPAGLHIFCLTPNVTFGFGADQDH